MARTFDLLIVGGGVNGCGIARDAAGRGLDVCLIEMNDLASATSSASTKLIHGGLRYLETYEFALVREALAEREVLLTIAPHLVRPLRFVLPVLPGMRPAWLLRLGLLLYDYLYWRRTLPGTATLDLRRVGAGRPLRETMRRGFEYSDCRVDDARLVILNARDAADRRASIRPRTKLLDAKRQAGLWRARVETQQGEIEEIAARALVNAAGPWAGSLLGRIEGVDQSARIRLDQGSHIVVRRMFEGEQAYIFQNADGRIVFAIPYEGDFTLIGTTDREYRADPAKVHAGEDDIAYLIEAANLYFRQQLSREDVVWTYAGVRALLDDGASAARATREYKLVVDAADGLPLLNVFGGKITAYRHLAEKALDQLKPFFPRMRRGPWTADEPLPGGDLPAGGLAALETALAARFSWLEPTLVARLARSYGTRVWALLGEAAGIEALGRHFGAGLYGLEVGWLMREEWAQTAEDVLWRRTKLGLRLSPQEAQNLELFMTSKCSYCPNR
ncbi:glycerol-3-phosphate dehydrogenase [Roseiarcaceae bacterium H3SJ34-1]|uniref:glycerol-3-phosphate dehydrogenase n=1 Tax=Terripilifer ovatus TaxID=3032367 RepID=UPI003AB989CC|nr:glycerol-3-phosphate dehydrogenase [Roseiarcaceae bacterium H3SJ34-1]